MASSENVNGSISNALLDIIKYRDETNFVLLWDRYFPQLVQFIQPRIYRRHRRLVDAEDIASATLAELINSLRVGDYHTLKNRDGLWRLLVVIGARKTTSCMRYHDRLKRGGGKVRNGSSVGDHYIEDIASEYASWYPAEDGSTDAELLICYELNELLEGLPEQDCRHIALGKLAGYTNVEIADELGIAVRSVDRKLKQIRDTWSAAGFANQQ